MLRSEGLPESESRIENLMELVNAAAEAQERSETLAEFLDHAALVSDADDYDERARVTLMTLHTAKGLEFSQVYLVGLEEGLCPHKLSLPDEATLEEERRLCYVGMTRARERLLLSWAEERRSFGYESFGRAQPSRFLKEIPDTLIDRLDLRGASRKPTKTWDGALNSVDSVDRFFRDRSARPRNHLDRQPGSSSSGSSGLTFSAPRRPARWKLGSRVRHPKYGLGTVVGCEGDGEDAKLTVSFPGYGQKKLVEKFAGLERA
jgi:DNA helicase-2/ATP-dependent DNA helicase PcrA